MAEACVIPRGCRILHGGAVSSRRLGKWLSRISGKIVDRRRIGMRVDGSHGNKFSLSRPEATKEDARAPLF